MPVLTTRDLNRALLARQLLLERAAIAPLAAIEHLAGLQAQDPGPPFIGLWARLEEFATNELLDLIEARAVVRGTLQRGTLHLVSSRDYLAMRAPLQPALDGAMKVLGDRAEGLDLDAVLPAARELLAAGPLTFGELRPKLAERFPHVDERALGYAVRTNLPLVMEATGDKWGYARSARFTLAEDWLAAVSPAEDFALLEGLTDRSAGASGPGEQAGGAVEASLPAELTLFGDEPLGGSAGASAGATPGADAPSQEASDGLVRRYLAAFGPATPQDFQAWSGIPDSAPSFERLRPELVTFEDDQGRELFDLPGAPRPPADTPAPARFIPEFDNLVLGHADRRRIIAEHHRPGLVTNNLRVRATFLYDGFAAGTWTIERKKKTATLLLLPFEKLPNPAIRTLKREGSRLLQFTDEHANVRSVDVLPAA